MSVIIETTLGDVTVDLYLEQRPRTCLNFLKLCKTKYYNLCLFHKVERNFIAQTGDPTATSRGGESIFCKLYGEQAKYFDAELKPRLKHEKFGTLSMVNNGNNMNGSQFFITLGENLTYLDEVHTVFGEVVEGFEILVKLNEALCDPNFRPYQDIRITHTVVLHDPYEDPEGLEIPPSSPVPTKEMLETNYIGADEEIDDTKGKNAEEIEEKIKESEAKARATILEMVGDIPDVDVKPPENVLFVCKLNPVTTSEDLEIIFSRFGPILSCEVIKDHKTGESLQYAFIEFEKEEDCENAYFKMDNVLIDDRRIHVDFSQSVSKLQKDMNSKYPQITNRKKDNLVLKENLKKSNDYDMLFDSDEAGNESNKKKEKIKSDKYKAKEKYSHFSKRSRSRSRSKSKNKLQRKKNYSSDDEKSEKYSLSPKRKFSSNDNYATSLKRHPSRSKDSTLERASSNKKHTSYEKLSSQRKHSRYNKDSSSDLSDAKDVDHTSHKKSNIKNSRMQDNSSSELSDHYSSKYNRPHKKSKHSSRRSSSPDLSQVRDSQHRSHKKSEYKNNSRNRNNSPCEFPDHNSAKYQKTHKRSTHSSRKSSSSDLSEERDSQHKSHKKLSYRKNYRNRENSSSEFSDHNSANYHKTRKQSKHSSHRSYSRSPSLSKSSKYNSHKNFKSSLEKLSSKDSSLSKEKKKKHRRYRSSS